MKYIEYFRNATVHEIASSKGNWNRCRVEIDVPLVNALRSDGVLKSSYKNKEDGTIYHLHEKYKERKKEFGSYVHRFLFVKVHGLVMGLDLNDVADIYDRQFVSKIKSVNVFSIVKDITPPYGMILEDIRFNMELFRGKISGISASEKEYKNLLMKLNREFSAVRPVKQINWKRYEDI